MVVNMKDDPNLGGPKEERLTVFSTLNIFCFMHKRETFDAVRHLCYNKQRTNYTGHCACHVGCLLILMMYFVIIQHACGHYKYTNNEETNKLPASTAPNRYHGNKLN